MTIAAIVAENYQTAVNAARKAGWTLRKAGEWKTQDGTVVHYVTTHYSLLSFEEGSKLYLAHGALENLKIDWHDRGTLSRFNQQTLP